VRRFVPLEPGELLDVDDPAIEQIRFRLLGTGWFDDVKLRLRRGSARGRVVLGVCHAGDLLFPREIPENYDAAVQDLHAFCAR